MIKSTFFTKILLAIKAKPIIGGLEIADSVLRFSRWNGDGWDMTSVRLQQDVIRGGEIQNRNEFLRALTTLKSQIVGSDTHAHLNVVVCVSSVNIYAQVFSIPLLEGEQFDQALALNIQMVSPANAVDTYSSSQILHRDQEKFRVEILAAFLDKKVVHGLNQILQDAGFTIVAVESRALSIARLMKHLGAGVDSTKSYIVLSVDADGIDVLIVRHGELYFDYFSSWRDIQADAREVSLDEFRSTIVRNVHQVLNFYNAHWQEPIEALFYLSTGMAEEVERVVKENFSLAVHQLKTTLPDDVPSDWFIALGAGIRGSLPRGSDAEISLLGIDAREQFRREQTIGFLRLWRTIVPITLSILLVTFFGVDFAIARIHKSLESQAVFHLPTDQLAAVGVLEKQAGEFNALVAMVASAEHDTFKTSDFILKIDKLARESQIAISRLYVQSVASPILLSGTAPSQDILIKFKKVLESDPDFQNVALPLANVQSSAQGVTFSMSFSLKTTNTP